MFTGIVEELGTVVAVEDRGDALRLTIGAATVLEDARPGDSIAVDGCCLTVASLRDASSLGSSGQATGSTSENGEPDQFTADVMQETLDKTSLAGVAPGDRVNLERPVTVESRLGGHIVQGHVDGVGRILRRTPCEHGGVVVWEVVEISLPAPLARYLVDKGSIAVDGISLTVVEAGDAAFTVSLIPETLARTSLGRKGVGDVVNLEADVLAKHVEKLLLSGVRPGGEQA